MPEWGLHMLTKEAAHIHFRWLRNGTAWEDTLGRQVGTSLFVGANSIRLTCFCHQEGGQSLFARAARLCGHIFYCPDVWDAAELAAKTFLEVGTRYAGERVILEQKHRQEMADRIKTKLTSLRRRIVARRLQSRAS